jgi:hypothetical protein
VSTAAPSNPYAVKYQLFPVSRNQVLVRLENIGDRYDTDDVKLSSSQTTVVYNLDSFARDLFAKANWKNKGINLTSVIYTEMGLSSNQAYTNVVNSKTNWNIRGQNLT